MNNFGLIEMAFSFGVVLALALWDLWRTPRPDKEKSSSPDDASGNDASE